MPEKDPTTWTAATWLLALGMAFGGGIVNWYAKVRRGHTRAFNIIELIGEIFTSGFVGLGVFMLLAAFEQPVGVCAAAGRRDPQEAAAGQAPDRDGRNGRVGFPRIPIGLE